MKMENTKHHRLTSFAETASEAPLQEPDRQYYFIEKAKDIFAEKCKEADRTLTFCVTTFGCQMNARDSEKLVYFRADRLCGRTGRGESRFCYL